jgi:hypothetical protein
MDMVPKKNIKSNPNPKSFGNINMILCHHSKVFERRGFQEDRRYVLMVILNGIYHEVKMKTNGKNPGKKSHEILH